MKGQASALVGHSTCFEITQNSSSIQRDYVWQGCEAGVSFANHKKLLNNSGKRVSSLIKEEGPIKITVLKRFDTKEVFRDLPVRAKYSGPCPDFKEGQVFIVNDITPTGFCSYAWDIIFPYVKALKSGNNFFEWYEEPGVVVACYPDGLKPVVFKLERK